MIAQTKAPAVRSGKGLDENLPGNSTHAQRRRLLARLRQGPLTTLEARRELDILMPAARVFELRALGYGIDTFRTDEATDCGQRHNVARYVLRGLASVAEPQGNASGDCGRRAEPSGVGNETE